MKHALLTTEAYVRALSLRDLTNPAEGAHAMQQLIDRIQQALCSCWGCAARVERSHPVVPVEHNYDRLHYPPDGSARDPRYTRYVSETTVMRTHTSAMIPHVIGRLAPDSPEDVLLMCPGLVYRRDQIDRLHTGEPHQMDVWRIAQVRLGDTELRQMIDAVVNAVLPGTTYRCNPAHHPYTMQGLEIEVRSGTEWVEVGECGLVLPAILDEAKLPASIYSGLAMGLGLDRLLMLRKGIDDIRLLRSSDPRVATQLLDLEPYRPVSTRPAITRDLSVAVSADRPPEELGDRVRQALGSRVESLESVQVMAETSYNEVPSAGRARIGMQPGQKNVLVRVVIRDLNRTLTREEANALRDAVYAALHEGTEWQWAVPPD
jgi:phenylalanyl-tRNA synthetase alpha chain